VGVVYETERLVVRDLAGDDAAALYEEHARLTKWEAHARNGLGFFAIVERTTGELVGVQILKPFDDLPHTDLGWRLRPDRWGRGYATESACGAVAYAFDVLSLDEVAAATLPDNRRSRAVMERLGMTYAGEVVHAGLPHVLYLLRA
jgi:RimJ/RimL family protein N-acetyltransferase